MIIKEGVFSAVNSFAANSDVRYYLNGVLVDAAARMIQRKRVAPTLIRPGGAKGIGYAQLDADGEVGAWVMPLRKSDLPTHPVWQTLT